MADNLQPMNETERQRALAVWERLLGIPLALRTLAEPNWTSASAPACSAAKSWWSRPARMRRGCCVWSASRNNWC
jgi:hypothetical protein